MIPGGVAKFRAAVSDDFWEHCSQPIRIIVILTVVSSHPFDLVPGSVGVPTPGDTDSGFKRSSRLAAGERIARNGRRMSTDAVPGGKPPLMSMPEIPRVLPFVLFLGIGALAGKAFAGSEYWMYAVKTGVVAVVLWAFRRRLPEMRWAFSPEAVGVGVGIAVLWILGAQYLPGLGRTWDLIREATGGPPAPAPKAAEAWNPVAHFAGQPALGWAFVVVRVLGRSLVVPPLEEVFYRSFAYRYIVKPGFESVAHSFFHLGAFLTVSAAFGLSHPDQWVPGILCGMAYQWLVLRKDRIGDAMTAHAITNLVISGYAIGTGRWEFS